MTGLAPLFSRIPEGLSAAEKTTGNFNSHAIRLYEQEEPSGSPLLGLYVRRWERGIAPGYTRTLDAFQHLPFPETQTR